MSPPVAELRTVVQSTLKHVATALCAGAIAFPALAEPATVVRLPASPNPGVFAAQKTLVEAWQIVGETFVDNDLNGLDWENELRKHMVAAFQSGDPVKAHVELDTMLEELGDPYTRVIPAEEYQSFLVSADGELQGVGLLIANEPVNNHLYVLAPIKGGPADRAGMQPGDEVLSINGTSIDGWTGEQAAKLLRGKGGTEVQVKFTRRTDGIPGVPGRPEPPPARDQLKEVRLRREKVALSPLYYTSFLVDGMPSGRPSTASGAGGVVEGGGIGSSAQERVGYIRLISFSNNAASEMRQAIKDLEKLGANEYILDLRSNPGGLVRAGIDVAGLWMDGQSTVLNITGRAGEPVQQVALDIGGAALTHAPLVVLVDHNSASASEILSGALRDNNRATIIGDTATYGKGRIQSVFELQDGSALFVTVAKYKTPNGTDIDMKGILPDRACRTPVLTSSAGNGFTIERPTPAPPVAGFGTEDALRAQLAADSCVLSAETVLHEQKALVASTSRVAAKLPSKALRSA